MARNSNKDIDFLSVYKTKKKININSKTLLLIALPVLLILIFATSHKDAPSRGRVQGRRPNGRRPCVTDFIRGDDRGSS